jgi:hypothetical protein
MKSANCSCDALLPETDKHDCHNVLEIHASETSFSDTKYDEDSVKWSSLLLKNYSMESLSEQRLKNEEATCTLK